MRIGHLTDLHLAPGRPDRWILTAVAEDLVGEAFQRLRDADLAVLTGDLADSADAGAADALERLLEAAPQPVRLVPGNHDVEVPGAREALLERFGRFLPGGTLPGAEYLGDTLVVGLDSTVTGENWGALPDAVLDWFADLVAAERPGQVVVALHHPPANPGMPTRIPPVAGADRLLSAAAWAGQATILCGHFHVPLHVQAAPNVRILAGGSTTSYPCVAADVRLTPDGALRRLLRLGDEALAERAAALFRGGYYLRVLGLADDEFVSFHSAWPRPAVLTGAPAVAGVFHRVDGTAGFGAARLAVRDMVHLARLEDYAAVHAGGGHVIVGEWGEDLTLVGIGLTPGMRLALGSAELEVRDAEGAMFRARTARPGPVAEGDPALVINA